MRLTITSLFSLALAAMFISSCKKESETSTVSAKTNAANNSSSGPSTSLARYSGENYSQSISIDAANTMISSYLSSVQFPLKDTAIRSFAFDADTLRSYLKDTSIKTIRLHMAHTPVQVQTNPGAYAGYKPQAITLIIVGYTEGNNIVKNRSNGVYEHFYPCPTYCNQSTTGLLQ